MRDDEPVVHFCKNCFGKKECMCDNKEYIATWEYVYNAWKSLNPTKI